MKLSPKKLLILAPGILLVGCGQAKKPTVAQTTSDQTPQAAASTPASADASVASATPAAAPATESAGPRQRGGGGGGRGGGDRGGDRMQRMATELSLTPDQTEKIKAIMEAARPAMDAIRNDASLSREDKRAKMMELRKTTDPQINAVLTPEQQTKWEAARAQMRAQMGNRGGGGGGENGGGGGTNPPASTPAN